MNMKRGTSGDDGKKTNIHHVIGVQIFSEKVRTQILGQESYGFLTFTAELDVEELEELPSLPGRFAPLKRLQVFLEQQSVGSI